MDDKDAVLAELTRQVGIETITDWCKRTGFSRAFTHRVLRGIDPPSVRMCEKLGFRKAVVYSRAER